MKMIKQIAAAFSMFSRLPVPRALAGDEEAPLAIAFFPLVGAVIGAAAVAVNIFAVHDFGGAGAPMLLKPVPAAVRILLTAALPLIVTGGIHADGFMDTEDALRSYLPPERKLEILNDPHAGAFAMIALAKYILIYLAAVSAVLLSPAASLKVMGVMGLSFVISRCLSGLTSLAFTKARPGGMLHGLTEPAGVTAAVMLGAELAAASALAVFLDMRCALAVLAGALGTTFLYRHMAYKEFGGVTGDTAGWYLTVLETVSMVMIGVMLYVP